MSKPPSSLHYSELLHELGLKNWQRALVARDWQRAKLNADRLARSTDRFWSWVGCCHLATTHLAQGEIEPALDCLTRAVGAFTEVPRFGAVARRQAAHVYLELGHAERAYQELSYSASRLEEESREELYWKALASAHLGWSEESLTLIEKFESQAQGWRRALVSHVRAELMERQGRRSEALETLRKARELMDAAATPRAAPLAPVRSRLAKLLHETGEREAAKEELLAVTADPETLVHWPIPYVRSFYFLGRYQLRDQPQEARRSLEAFVSFWGEGQLEGELVREAKAQLRRVS